MPQLNHLPRRSIEHVLDLRRQAFQVLLQRGFIELRGHEHIRAESVTGHNEGLAELSPDRRDETLDGVFLDFAHGRHILGHAARQAGFRQSEHDCVEVPQNNVPIPQRQRRCRHLTGDHLHRLVEKVLVVRRGAAVSDYNADAGTAAGTATALCVIVRPWRNVPQHHRIQPADIATHLQRRRTSKDVNLGFVPRRLEVVLQFHALGVGHLSRVLARHEWNDLLGPNPLNGAVYRNLGVLPGTQ